MPAVDVVKKVILSLPFISSRTNRQRVKYCLQSVKRLIRRKQHLPFDVTELRVPNCETFFGYYELPPISKDNTKLLAHAVEGKPQKVNGTQTCHIGFFDMDTAEFHKISETHAWCWQMGSRLRWHPISDDLVMFNDTLKTEFVTRVFNLKSNSFEKTLPLALYDVSPDGEYGISIDFCVLGKLRPGYGYISEPNTDKNPSNTNVDGLCKVDLKKHSTETIVSMDSLIEQVDAEHQAKHYINHVKISPNSKLIMFFHLWSSENSSHCRLMLVNKNGENLRQLGESGKPSHYDWLNDNELLVTFAHENDKENYILFNVDGTQRVIDYLPNRDGHPSLSKCDQYLLTDSYPDSFGEQNIEIFKLPTREKSRIGKYKLHWRYLDGELRCDLHPRWGNDATTVVFDSTHKGYRAIYVKKLPSDFFS